MAKIMALGELLIDFTPCEGENGVTLYQQNAGGAPANVVVQASILGADCGFIGRVGEDDFGHFLEKALQNYNVDTRGLSFDNDWATTLTFVQLFTHGRHNFKFYRNPGADTMLKFEDIDLKLIDECSILHFGSLSMTAEPSKTATIKAVQYAKSKGKIISYDPNWREQLWPSKAVARQTMRSVLKDCDIIKVSEEELEMLTDCDILFQGIAALIKIGIKIVVVTQGPRGCVVAFKKELERLQTYDTDVVDTTGAGDSFFGAFLSKLSASGKSLEELSLKECIEFADYANACGAMTSTKKGAMTAMANNEEILGCMKNIPKFH